MPRARGRSGGCGGRAWLIGAAPLRSPCAHPAHPTRPRAGRPAHVAMLGPRWSEFRFGLPSDSFRCAFGRLVDGEAIFWPPWSATQDACRWRMMARPSVGVDEIFFAMSEKLCIFAASNNLNFMSWISQFGRKFLSSWSRLYKSLSRFSLAVLCEVKLLFHIKFK